MYIADKQIAIDENAFLERSQDEPEPECKHKDILSLGEKCLDVLFPLSITFPQKRDIVKL
jgi:hypothetical protein